VPLAYNSQTGNSTLKLAMGYENVTKKVLFYNTAICALMSGNKYGKYCDIYIKMADVT
jgi:hypothetical protein